MKILARSPSGPLAHHRTTGALIHRAPAHPGYTTSQTHSGLYGSTSAYAELDYDDDFDSNVLSYLQTQLNASIAAIATPRSSSTVSLSAGHYPAGGILYNFHAWAECGGQILAISALNSAPFGNPTGDVEVTLTPNTNNAGITTSAYFTLGFGTTPPGADPRLWPGTIYSSSRTFANIPLAPYIWVSVLFTPNPTLYDNYGLHHFSASLTLTTRNIRYHT